MNIWIIFSTISSINHQSKLQLSPWLDYRDQQICMFNRNASTPWNQQKNRNWNYNRNNNNNMLQGSCWTCPRAPQWADDFSCKVTLTQWIRNQVTGSGFIRWLQPSWQTARWAGCTNGHWFFNKGLKLSANQAMVISSLAGMAFSRWRPNWHPNIHFTSSSIHHPNAPTLVL